MRYALIFLIACCAAYADSSIEIGKPLPCKQNWIWEQGKIILGIPFTTFDFSANDPKLDAIISGSIENGKSDGLMNAIVESLKKGASVPTSVEISGTYRALKAVLTNITPRLGDSQLPHLKILIVGPEKVQEEYQLIFQGRGAIFNFTSNEHRNCE